MKTRSVVLLVVLALGCGKKHEEPQLSGSDIETLDDHPAKKVVPATPIAVEPPAPAELEPTPSTGSATFNSEAEYVAADLAMLKKIVGVYKTDGSDCDKLAADIAKVADEANLPAMDAYEAAHPEFQPKPDVVTDQYVKAFKNAAEKVREKCAPNSRYLDALMKF